MEECFCGSKLQMILPTPSLPQEILSNVLEAFLVITMRGNVTGIQWVEARIAAKHPIMCRTA